MTEVDLPAVEAWLRLPHVARWWTPDTTAEAEIAKYRERVRQNSKPATHMLMVTLDSTPIGWCQWYRWADYPADAEAMGARDGEIGIDYAIGDPARGLSGRSPLKRATPRWPSTVCPQLRLTINPLCGCMRPRRSRSRCVAELVQHRLAAEASADRTTQRRLALLRSSHRRGSAKFVVGLELGGVV
jgi:hypothetical protein